MCDSWFYALHEHPPEEDVARITRESKGRLGTSAKMASKFGIEITAAGLLVDERLVRITELWSVCRKIVLKHIRMHVAKGLAERRPAYYDGLCGFNCKEHLKALAEVDSYTASCYLKILTGTVMTGARRAQMGNGTGECPCGAALCTHAVGMSSVSPRSYRD